MTENPFQLGLLELPESSDLGIRHFSGIFNNTTNSYKFYWLLAILEAVKNGYVRPSFDLLTAEMIAQAWYPVLICHLNFGGQDELSNLVQLLKKQAALSELSQREDVRNTAIRNVLESAEFKNKFHQLQRYVPQRLLRPWFSNSLIGLPDHQIDKQIQLLAEQNYERQEYPPLYKFWNEVDNKGIEIHPDWMTYLSQNFRIVRAFVLWSLLAFLQQRNPYVPNLQEKLFPPIQRNLEYAHKYWDWVLKREKILCPFSEQPIPLKGYSLDHFLPWSFVGHDQLWNLFPVSKSVNSSKSDKLPKLNKYLHPFTIQQYQAMQLFFQQADAKPVKAKEDYVNLFRCDDETIKNMSLETFSQHFMDTFVPLEQMAANMGFVRGWEYFA
jgi:hypothetical protein